MSSSVLTARELKPLLRSWGLELEGDESHSDLLEAYYYMRPRKEAA